MLPTLPLPGSLDGGAGAGDEHRPGAVAAWNEPARPGAAGLAWWVLLARVGRLVLLRVHGIWSADHALCLWVERADDAARPGLGAVRAPWDGAVLAAADADAHLGWLAAALRTRARSAIDLWLPAASPPNDARSVGRSPQRFSDRPLDRSREPPTAADDAALSLVHLPTIRLFPARAADFLARVANQVARSDTETGTQLNPPQTGSPCHTTGDPTQTTAPEPIVMADDLVYLARVATGIGRLVDVGQVAPTLTHSGGEWWGRWTLVPVTPVTAWLAEVAAAMPPVLRAESATGRAGRDILDDLALELVDLEVRRRIAQAGATLGLSPTARRSPLLDWLTSLETGQPVGGWGDAGLATLGERVHLWRTSATISSYELLLRLTEPPQPDAAGLDAADFDTTEPNTPDVISADLNATQPDPTDPGFIQPDAADPRATDLDATQPGPPASSAATQPNATQPGPPASSASDGPDWRLEVRLRSIAEPGLVFDAASVRSQPDAPDDPGAFLAAEYARAGAAYPPLFGFASRQGFDRDLTTDQAVGLVAVGGPVLRAAGFAIQVPSNWIAPSLTLRLTESADDDARGAGPPGGMGLDAVANFAWRAALGDTELSQADLRALADAKAPLVRMRGRWVQIDPAAARRTEAFLRRGGGGASLGQLLAAFVGGPGLAPDDAVPVPVSSLDVGGWLGDLLSGRAAERISPVGPPTGLEATLRPYQERGLAWLAFMSKLGLGAILADDMGLGKTIQLLALVLAEKERSGPAGDAHPGPTLVVCPMSVVGNWQREAARFTPSLTVYVHHGPDRASGAGLAAVAGRADIVVTTYGLLTRDLADLARIAWRRVALDEAQHIKNAATRQARAARAVGGIGGSGGVRTHRVALTGTPVENRLEDLRSILDFANPGLLGSAASFRERFAIPIEQEHQPLVTARLNLLTRPFILRREKTDPAVMTDLPEKHEMVVRANLTAEQAGLYQAVVDEMMAHIAGTSGTKRRGQVLATLTKLKQICNHPAHFLGDGSGVLRRGQHRSGKLALVEDILDSVVGEGERVLCFTQYREFGQLIQPWLTDRYGGLDADGQPRPIPFFHGGLARRARETMVDDFQSADGPPILLLSLKAGGTGLNLTAASQVIHLDRWWNPAVETQATDRAYRIGQTQRVQVRKFSCVGTLEERIDALIASKLELASLAVGSGESWLTELDTDQLRELIELSADAVGD